MLAQDMEIGKKYRSTAFKRPVELVRIDSVDSNGEASVTVKYYEKYYSDCSFRMEPMPEDVKKPKKVKKEKTKELWATSIKWDTDGVSARSLGLPTSVKIPKSLYSIYEEDGYNEEIENYLSDEYGYCLYGFNLRWKPVK